ncbi:MAG: hypothetical protein ABIJ09_19635 [Pseudomonadota bacterium]
MSACAVPDVDPPDAGATASDAAGVDGAVATAATNIVGVWQQPVTNYPDLMVVWAFSAAGWGNVDVRGGNGTWCRNHVSWQITSEHSPSLFSLSYTFEAPPCGNASQGDTLTLNVLGEVQAEPLSLSTDWGGGAQMTLCTRAVDVDDACAVGDDRGVPAQDP